jgi:hypothetical protein|tara:strand:+ start:1508 stop:1735 length:228 start_codon:yes stop_codon:yes gene_type:complete
MKDSPYKGKQLEFNEVWHLIQVLKFYYEDVIKLAPKEIAEILMLEFGCKVDVNDVSLNILLAPHRDSDGNLICYE